MIQHEHYYYEELERERDQGWRNLRAIKSIATYEPRTGINVINWAKELEKRGIGELLITSIDKEGTQRGFDIELYSSLAKEVNLPIIASGGAGNINHIKYFKLFII